jgi:hypothetical protein
VDPHGGEALVDDHQPPDVPVEGLTEAVEPPVSGLAEELELWVAAELVASEEADEEVAGVAVCVSAALRAARAGSSPAATRTPMSPPTARKAIVAIAAIGAGRGRQRTGRRGRLVVGRGPVGMSFKLRAQHERGPNRR